MFAQFLVQHPQDCSTPLNDCLKDLARSFFQKLAEERDETEIGSAAESIEALLKHFVKSVSSSPWVPSRWEGACVDWLLVGSLQVHVGETPDPINCDNAWLDLTAIHFHVPYSFEFTSSIETVSWRSWLRDWSWELLAALFSNSCFGSNQKPGRQWFCRRICLPFLGSSPKKIPLPPMTEELAMRIWTPSDSLEERLTVPCRIKPGILLLRPINNEAARLRKSVARFSNLAQIRMRGHAKEIFRVIFNRIFLRSEDRWRGHVFKNDKWGKGDKGRVEFILIFYLFCTNRSKSESCKVGANETTARIKAFKPSQICLGQLLVTLHVQYPLLGRDCRLGEVFNVGTIHWATETDECSRRVLRMRCYRRFLIE